jgi:SagB-type dehydrogenase family enzyme
MVRLRLREGLNWDRSHADGLVLSLGGRSLRAMPLRESVITALVRLEHGATREELSHLLVDADDWDVRAQLDFTLDSLAALGALTWTVMWENDELVTLEPDIAAPAPLRDSNQCRHKRHRLSPFAFIRAVGGRLVLESPCSTYRLLLHDPRSVTVLHELRGMGRPERSQVPEAIFNALIGLLCRAGFLEDSPGNTESDVALAQWDFHELLFHVRSRQDREVKPRGLKPPPAVVPTSDDGGIPLFRPDLARLAVEDPPLTRVLEARRSIRSYDGAALTAAQLGEFLYRTARVRKLRPGILDEVCDKPYPSGGARHALEIYPAVRECEGLDPGLYRYDGLGHRLHRVREYDASVASLVHRGSPDSSSQAQPPVLLVIAARFQRVQWAYHSYGYALILKDTGVLMQTMYLVATAMGLAPCAVGHGNSELFAECVGTRPEIETSVGEFALGGVPQEKEQRC